METAGGGWTLVATIGSHSFSEQCQNSSNIWFHGNIGKLFDMMLS